MTAAAQLFTWEGRPPSGGTRLIGTVWVGEDGRAVWDDRLAHYFEPMPNDPRTGAPLDPADGATFVNAMPFVYRSPPYTWAEVAVVPPCPDPSTPTGGTECIDVDGTPF